jgi:hypothetical protein
MYVFNVLIMIVEKSCNNFNFSVSSKAQKSLVLTPRKEFTPLLTSKLLTSVLYLMFSVKQNRDFMKTRGLMSHTQFDWKFLLAESWTHNSLVKLFNFTIVAALEVDELEGCV